MLLNISKLESLKLRKAIAFRVAYLLKQAGSKSSPIRTFFIFTINPFSKEQKTSLYTVFYSYSEVFKTDEQRLKFLSDLQHVLYGAKQCDESLIGSFYESERKRYFDAYAKALSIFSSVRLTTALESTVSFVSKNYPKFVVA
jgi:hypothetical protein